VLEANYQRQIAGWSVPDADQARQYLLGIIERETSYLDEKAQVYAEREAVAVAVKPHRMAFDESREGKLMRRYETGCQKFFLQCLGQLDSHRAKAAERSQNGIGTTYYLPSHRWFEPLRGDEQTREPGSQSPALEAIEADQADPGPVTRVKTDGPNELATAVKCAEGDYDAPAPEAKRPGGNGCESAAPSRRPTEQADKTPALEASSGECRAGSQNKNGARKISQTEIMPAVKRAVSQHGARLLVAAPGMISTVVETMRPLSNRERKRRKREDRAKARAELASAGTAASAQ
jgi:hypothetical protein